MWLNLASILTCWNVRAVFATHQQEYCHIPVDLTNKDAAVPTTALIPAKPRRGDIFLALDLAPRLIVRHEQQLASWRRDGVVIAMVVYDLLALTQPAWFTRRTRRNLSRWFDVLVRQADYALCISNIVAHDVARRTIDAKPPRSCLLDIRHIPLGSDIGTSTAPVLDAEEQALAATLRSRRFALMVGTVEPRKGYRQVLAAYDRLWTNNSTPEPTLVILGKPGWRTWLLQRRLRRHRENGKKLFWFSTASDALLSHLYHECSFVIQASFGEGFGLPLVEALAHGRHVLARDIPIFREVGGEDVTFFGKDDPTTLSTAILGMIERTRESVAVEPSARLMTWRQCAERLLWELGIEQNARGACLKGEQP
jgi:glycosyltransferase involved in cell wall biosynthesis